MKSADTERRTAAPSINAYRGQGVCIKFLCPRCDRPSLQLGSKLRHYQGLRQRVCAKCDEEMKR